MNQNSLRGPCSLMIIKIHWFGQFFILQPFKNHQLGVKCPIFTYMLQYYHIFCLSNAFFPFWSPTSDLILSGQTTRPMQQQLGSKMSILVYKISYLKKIQDYTGRRSPTKTRQGSTPGVYSRFIKVHGYFCNEMQKQGQKAILSFTFYNVPNI